MRKFFLAAMLVAGVAYGQYPMAPMGQVGKPQPMLQPEAGNNFTAKAQAPSRLGENSPLKPPFTETFDNFRNQMEHEDFVRYFQVIDANEDNRNWRFYNYAGDRPFGKCAYLLYPLEAPSSDDWLITRAIKLEAGKYYPVSVDGALFRDADIPEIFEVKIGQFNDADGFDYLVIPSTKVYSSEMTRHYGWFCPPVDGKYYVGVHGITPRYGDTYYNYLFIDNISVAAAKSGKEPGQVSDISFSNDVNGTTRLDISFKAPDKDIAGNDLAEITSITVTRGSTKVKDFTSVTPGQVLQFSDTPDAEGTYQYTFTVANSHGEGASMSAQRFAGIAEPVAPRILSVREAEKGWIEVEWEAPATDVNGMPINPDLVKYSLYEASTGIEDIVAPAYSGTSGKFDMHVDPGEQKLALIVIRAMFNGKESEPAASDIIAVGTPYPIPHKNSFTLDDWYKYVMVSEIRDDVTWKMLDANSDPKPQDSDNGYLCMIGTTPDQSSIFQTGKIDLKGAEHPSISLYTYVYANDENLLNIYVLDCETYERSLVKSVSLSQFTRTGWTRLRYLLDEFKDKVVCFLFEGVIKTHGYLPVDNLVIDDLPKVDLSVVSTSAPGAAAPGEPIAISAVVKNVGANDVESFTALLRRDGMVVDTKECGALAADASTTITFADEFTAATSGMPTFTVEVVAENEGYPEDNISDPFQMALKAPSYPTPVELKAEESDGGAVNLMWTAPELSRVATATVTEGFESYNNFATELDGWTMVDVDQGVVLGFNGVDMPVANTPQAYWVMNSVEPFDFIVPHSGTHLLVQMCVDPNSTTSLTCDDWLISPELYGGTQTICLWVSSLNAEYGLEQFEVYASSTDKELTSFKKVLNTSEAPVEWTPFYVTLPEGSRYFALRCVSPDVFMMLVDDIEYIPVSAEKQEPHTLLGYNVYRNAVKLNSEPVTATTFTTSRDQLTDRYMVTAVYRDAESAGSNEARLGVVSIDSVEGDAEVDGPVEYYNIQGLPVKADNLTSGFYIRKQGAKAEVIRL